LSRVNAKQNNGQLTPQQAADLSQQAKAIQQAIGCSNISGMLGQTSLYCLSQQAKATQQAIG
jgi:hypothetical protein